MDENMKNAVEQPMGAGSGPMRNKAWAELTISEQIERMREVVKNLQHVIEHVARTAYAAREIATAHAHVESKVMVPPSMGQMSGTILGQTSNQDYF